MLPLPGDLLPYVREQCHRASPLDRSCNTTLVFRGDARNSARHDLATLGDKLPQKIDITPIDIIRHDLPRSAPLVASGRLVAEHFFTAAETLSLIKFVINHNLSRSYRTNSVCPELVTPPLPLPVRPSAPRSSGTSPAGRRVFRAWYAFYRHACGPRQYGPLCSA